MVITHETSDVASKSVGEKASPFPQLSTGASVMISTPDLMCVEKVLSGLEYVNVYLGSMR